MTREGVASTTGVVVIGRNEGERLRRCLASVCGSGLPVIYVDSASTDHSLDIARSMGCDLVELGSSRPLTASRARNEGFDLLCRVHPTVQFIQFVDGDCILREGWIEAAVAEMSTHSDLAIVCGRLHERHADTSMYKRLAAMEWDQPIGDVKYTGGIFMVRRIAFEEAGGFNGQMICAADPELCVRIRQHQWRIFRADMTMALHDAAMERMGQWWWRSVRCGHGYADGAALHGRSPDRFYVRQVHSAVFWGLFLPMGIIVSAGVTLAWSSWAWIVSGTLLAGYPLLGCRVYRATRRQGRTVSDALLYAMACVVGKLPVAIGILRYGLYRLLKWQPQSVTHKDA